MTDRRSLRSAILVSSALIGLVSCAAVAHTDIESDPRGVRLDDRHHEATSRALEHFDEVRRARPGWRVAIGVASARPDDEVGLSAVDRARRELARSIEADLESMSERHLQEGPDSRRVTIRDSIRIDDDLDLPGVETIELHSLGGITYAIVGAPSWRLIEAFRGEAEVATARARRALAGYDRHRKAGASLLQYRAILTARHALAEAARARSRALALGGVESGEEERDAQDLAARVDHVLAEGGVTPTRLIVRASEELESLAASTWARIASRVPNLKYVSLESSPRSDRGESDGLESELRIELREVRRTTVAGRPFVHVQLDHEWTDALGRSMSRGRLAERSGSRTIDGARALAVAELGIQLEEFLFDPGEPRALTRREASP